MFTCQDVSNTIIILSMFLRLVPQYDYVLFIIVIKIIIVVFFSVLLFCYYSNYYCYYYYALNLIQHAGRPSVHF